MKFILSFLFVIALFSISQAETICEVKRHALYDVGSGSTKLTVVETNSCKGPEVLLNTSEKVDYKEDLLKSQNSELSEAVQVTGLEALKKLKAEAVKLNSNEHRGIATAAFREAKNASALMTKIKDQLNISIEVISQEQEAQLAYKAVQLRYSEPSLVWDIGGASFQITTHDKLKNEWNIFKGTLAAVVFKDLIIKQVKNKPELSSPNPLTKAELKKSRKLVGDQLKSELKKSFLAKRSYKKVIGIGGVFAASLKGHLKKSVFTVQDIDQWLKANHNKTDAELNDKYASTVISNMILVSEMMKILKIKSVEAVDVTLVEGLLN